MRSSARWLVAFVATLAATMAHAAGPFDGSWQGVANGTQASGLAAANQCVATITATVADNVVKGTLAFPRATTPLAGTIAPDGSFTSVGGGVTGKFVGGSFTGSLTIPNGYCSPYRVAMKRS